MTFLMFNGFEGYADPVDQRDAGDGISGFDESGVMEYTTGRNGGNGLKNVSTVWNRVVYMKFPAISSGIIGIVGFAVKINTYRDSTISWFGNSADVDGMGVDITGSSFYFYIKSFAIKASTIFNFNLNQWYYIEFKLKLHNSSGYGQVRVNEQEILTYPSGDMIWSGSIINQFKIGMLRSSDSVIDDVYVADNQGSDINDYLGDIRVDVIHPNGAGNYTDLTPSTGNNYECVDETEFDDSDYVEGANAAEKDSYTYQDVPTDLDDSGIIGLQIKHNAQRTAAATNIKIDPFIRIGSTDYSQTAQDLSDEFSMVDGDIVLDDPSDSNPWTQAKINACEFGVEVA